MKKTKKVEKTFEIYAELSKKQYDLVINGDADLELPYGVQMSNRKGSRSLSFSCKDGETAKLLADGLDNSSINWQWGYFSNEPEEPQEYGKTKKTKSRNSRYPF